MTYEVAKPFLKKGMKVKVIKAVFCNGYCSGETFTMKNDYEEESMTHHFNGKDEIEILTNPDGTPWRGVASSPTPLKVGNRVRANRNWEFAKNYNGSEGTIIKTAGKYLWSDCEVEWDKFGIIHNTWDNLEKIEDEPESLVDKLTTEFALSQAFAIEQQIFNQIMDESTRPTKKGFMNSIVKKIKDLKLSKEDRILREEYLEDENGVLTETAHEMMHQELVEERWAARRKEVAADLLEIAKEK